MIRGAGDVLIAWLTPFPIALFLLFVYGLCTSTGMVVYNSIMQVSVPDRVKGRVFTLMDMTWSVMEVISIGLGGLMADALGIRAVYYLGGGLLVAAGLCGLIFFHRRSFADATMR